MAKQTADQLLDRLSAIDEEISEIAVELRKILVDEEVIES